MAPIKFEENMREKLEERTINPSTKSWDALASRLDEAPVKKKTNRFWLMNIAASIVGVLLLVTGIVNYNNEDPNKVVDTKTETNATKENLKIDKSTSLFEGAKNEDIVEAKVETENRIEAVQQQQQQLRERTVQSLANAVTSKKNNTTVNAKNSVNTIERIKSNKKEDTNKDYIALNIKHDNSKRAILQDATIIEQNIAGTSTTKNEIIKVTDNELDALLNNAQKDIAGKSSSKPVPLDYNELLQDVEDNLEESFRDKILKTVKGGYRSVKSYVAERNE
jgi:hypothetical protein